MTRSYAPKTRDVFRSLFLEGKLKDISQGSRLSDTEILHLLQRCIKEEDAIAIKSLHSIAVIHQLDSISISNLLIRAFGSCGSLLEVNLVFSGVLNPCISTWNSLVLAQINHGEALRALHFYYESRRSSGFKRNRGLYPCIIKACAKLGDLEQGNLIHIHVVCDEFESEVIIGSSLIDMYAKCGSIEDARKVFNGLPNRNVVIWNAMLTGYIQQGDGFSALDLVKKMHVEGIQPDKVLYLCILQACSGIGSLYEGRLAHDQIIREEISVDSLLGSTLIDLYSKCGSLEDACKVFENFSHKSMVSMGAMVAAYVHHEHNMCALKLFYKMQEINLNPDKVTCLCLLRACSNIHSSIHGKVLHDYLVRNSMESDIMVANTLMSMYCKYRTMNEARYVFNTLKNRDVVSFGVMIAGYVQQGLCHSALELFWKMEKSDEATFVWSLQACTLNEGYLIHCQAVTDGMELYPAIVRALIDMYGRCKCLTEMDNAFHSLSNKNILLWSAIIAGYAEQGYPSKALVMFDKLQEEMVLPDKITYLYAMKACIAAESLEKGMQLYCQIVSLGLESDLGIGSTLIDMFSKCGSLREAHAVFNSLPQQNVVTWSVLVSGYAQSGYISVAFELLNEMQEKGVYPDRVIFLCLLSACPSFGTVTQCKLIHDQIVKHGFHLDAILGNSLVDIYGKCGYLTEAQRVFDRLANRDMISWCSIISLYAENGVTSTALQLFKTMQKESIQPNEVILLCVIKACCNEEALQEGRSTHHGIIHRGFGSDVVLGSALIDMYSKCGCVDDAYGVFNSSKYHDVVSWTAMMTAYTQHGEDFSTLELFRKMKEKRIEPNAASFLAVVKACGNIGAVVQGHLVHNLIVRSEFYSDGYLGNALVNMYATFGRLKDAFKVFSTLPEQDRISWEALIGGLSQQGNFDLARRCFEVMQQKGLVPQDTTYSNILSACSHGGEVNEGNIYFKHGGDQEVEKCTKTEHFNCMIDLFGRAGFLEAAEEMLLSMPNNPDIIGWMTLLSACKTHGRVDLGKRCFHHVAQHEAAHAAAGYALMSSIYNDAQLSEDVDGVFDLTKSLGAWKIPGPVLIQLDDNLDKFIVGNDSLHHHVGDQSQGSVDGFDIMVTRDGGCIPCIDSVSEPMQESCVSKQSPDIVSSTNYPSKQDIDIKKFNLDSSTCTNIVSDSNDKFKDSLRPSFYM